MITERNPNYQKIELQLNSFRTQLDSDVLASFSQKGKDFAYERYESWENRFITFLGSHLPTEVEKFRKKTTRLRRIGLYETQIDFFRNTRYSASAAFIESLLIDISNNDYIGKNPPDNFNKPDSSTEDINTKSIFIVHGHDEGTKQNVARFIERLGYKAIILHEQASKGKTIIDKLDEYTNKNNIGFAIILYTPDDEAKSKRENNQVEFRARQNVVFEHGYLMAKLGRDKVAPLVTDDSIEMPSDVSGVVYISNTKWEIDIAKEMKAAGYNIDFNKLF